MRLGRYLVLGLIVLAATVAFGSDEQPAPDRTAVALPSYTPPVGAPGFCTLLADSTRLTRIPTAVGTLAARPDDGVALGDLTAAVTELQIVLDEIVGTDRYAQLEATLHDLTAALSEATDEPVTEGAWRRIGRGLDDLGAQVQPLCEFPV